jgi:hypothetical protein
LVPRHGVGSGTTMTKPMDSRRSSGSDIF